VNLALAADAPPAIKIHLATVIPAFVIGTWLIFFSAEGALVPRVGRNLSRADDCDGGRDSLHPQPQFGPPKPHSSLHPADPAVGTFLHHVFFG
jgi:hypothetical protein